MAPRAGWTGVAALGPRPPTATATREDIVPTEETVPYSQKHRLLSIKTQLGEQKLLLERLQGTESLSAPFELELTMLSTLENIDMKKLLRTPATITLSSSDDRKRYFHGIFRSLSQPPEDDDLFAARESMGFSNPSRDIAVYRGVLVPKLWFLGLDANCRIFQNMTVPDIVEKILKENGISDFQFRAPIRDSSRYPEREYCVQYRESNLNFISRLLEEEGIFYFFDHTDSKHTIIFADNSSILASCPGQASATYVYNSEGWVKGKEEGVGTIDRIESAHSGKSTLTDYNFEKPSLNLKANLSTDNEEVFDYPGLYDDLTLGDRYARVRLEEHEASQFVVIGTSICRSFRPGYNFKLKNHFRADTNQDYFLTSVTHDGYDSSYRQDSDESQKYTNTFRAIPKSIKYRPPRHAMKPVVQGPQPAVVVGKAGEEIWVDKYGRVKVQFFWDREGKKNENSSCWVRVSQIWAGKNWGWITIPRMGQEVIVDFLEGDPDRPIITGRVYNAEQMPPYGLPANQTQSGIKTRSSKGGAAENFNEIRFEDKKGSEEVYVHAEKDMNTVVEHDDDQKIMNDRTIKVDGKHTEVIVKDTSITINEGNHSLDIKMGNQSIKVDQGNQSTQIAMGNQSTKIDMGNQTIKLGMGNQTTTLDLGKVETTALQSIELKVMDSSIKIDPVGVTIKGMMITIDGEIMTEVKAGAILICKGGITMIN
jgi:type VI secretion system secreted protein VgrG